MQMTAPTSFSELLMLGCVTTCVSRCELALSQGKWLLWKWESKEWTSAHSLVWLYLYTKGTLWRTSCVRIHTVVCLLERLLGSYDIILGVGGVSFVVLPFKLFLPFSILSLVSCHLCLLPCRPTSKLFTPFPLSGLFIWSTASHTKVQLLGRNTQCKATKSQFALAAWINYFSPFVCSAHGRMLLLVSWHAVRRASFFLCVRVHSKSRMAKFTTLTLSFYQPVCGRVMIWMADIK